MKNLLHVRIQDSKKVLWEGKAQAVSSTNTEGVFDILYQHANFITLVEKAPIRVLDSGREKVDFNFDRAVIFVRNNFVSVYTF